MIEARERIKNDENESMVKLGGDRTLSPGECSIVEDSIRFLLGFNQINAISDKLAK